MAASTSATPAASAWRLALARSTSHRKRTALPTCLRLVAAATVWLSVAAVGALGFWGLESSHEIERGRTNQNLQLTAGLLHEWPDGTVRHNKPPRGGGGGGGGKAGGDGGGGGGDGGGGGGGGGGGEGEGGKGKGKGGGRMLSEVDVSSGDIIEECVNSTAQLEAMSGWVDRYQNQCRQPPPCLSRLQWTAAGSLFFAFQVMSTVGYGTFVPDTTGGRAFTCVFGTVGIVCTGFVLGVFTNALDALLERTHHKLLPRRSYHNRGVAIRFKMLATLAILIVYMGVLAAIAAALGGDEMNFGNAFYFVFVSISTVGLGDFTLPAETIGNVLAQIALLFPGLIIFAQIVNLGSEASATADARVSEASSRARISAASRLGLSARLSKRRASSQAESSSTKVVPLGEDELKP